METQETQITIQAVSNGYVIFPSSFYMDEKNYFLQSNSTYVFHTIEQVASWMEDNFKILAEREK